MYPWLRLLASLVVALAVAPFTPARAGPPGPTDEEIFGALRKAMRREPLIQIQGKPDWVPLREAKTAGDVTGLFLR
jgi:hypothetical protein